MKKLMYVAVFAMALGFTSCGADDVIDFACDQARESLKVTVQSALDDYELDSSSTTCEAAKTAIQSYKESACGDAFFDEFLADLPDDCASLDSQP